MSLRALAASDAQDLIDLDGEEITITFPTAGEVPGAVYVLSAMYIRRGVKGVDAEGIPIPGDTSVITVSLAALADLGLTDPEDLRDTKGITVSAAGVSYLIPQGGALLDRTLGVATIILKRAS